MTQTRYKLVCFDLDGTLVDDTIFVWQTLHDHFGTDKEERKNALDRYNKKEITYQEWVDHDVKLFNEKGMTRDKLVEAISGLRLMLGAKEAVTELKKKGMKLAVISGSIDIVLEVLFPDHPFDDVLINRFEFDNEGRLLRGIGTKFDFERKALGLKQIAEREGFKLDECVFIGDNHNDIQIAEIAGLSIAFNSKSETLSEICDVVIPKDVKDIRAILPFILDNKK